MGPNEKTMAVDKRTDSKRVAPPREPITLRIAYVSVEVVACGASTKHPYGGMVWYGMV